MEKYGLYRDKGSGIAPFFTIASPASHPLLLPYHAILFLLRISFLTFAWSVWLFVVQWLPAGNVLRKANLWCILGIPGVWWSDIRVDGVQRGSLGRAAGSRLPGPGTIIASSFTSPLDVIYLAAIFDPIFTQSYSNTRHVRQLTLEGALLSSFSIPTKPHNTIPLADLVAQNPSRIIVVFPESTTSNGRGVLRLSTSLLGAGKSTPIFPVSLRYTPADVVTPIPGPTEAVRFLWKLCSRQTHCIRVRIGLPMKLSQIQSSPANTPAIASTTATPPSPPTTKANGYETNYFDSLAVVTLTDDQPSTTNGRLPPDATARPSAQESRALDALAEALSRLGRAKTLGLGVEDKARFVDAWTGKSKKKR